MHVIALFCTRKKEYTAHTKKNNNDMNKKECTAIIVSLFFRFQNERSSAAATLKQFNFSLVGFICGKTISFGFLGSNSFTSIMQRGERERKWERVSTCKLPMTSIEFFFWVFFTRIEHIQKLTHWIIERWIMRRGFITYTIQSVILIKNSNNNECQNCIRKSNNGR